MSFLVSFRLEMHQCAAAIGAGAAGCSGHHLAHGRHVLLVIGDEHLLLLVLLGEEEEDQRRADQHGDDAGKVGIGVAGQEGGLGRGRDLRPHTADRPRPPIWAPA